MWGIRKQQKSHRKLSAPMQSSYTAAVPISKLGHIFGLRPADADQEKNKKSMTGRQSQKTKIAQARSAACRRIRAYMQSSRYTCTPVVLRIAATCACCGWLLYGLLRLLLLIPGPAEHEKAVDAAYAHMQRQQIGLSRRWLNDHSRGPHTDIQQAIPARAPYPSLTRYSSWIAACARQDVWMWML
jgi:hypothetical protein